MEATLERKKKQNEERRKAWEEQFDNEQLEIYEKVYRQYPELQYEELAAARQVEEEKANAAAEIYSDIMLSNATS
jgi:hypothetical protein